MKKVLDKRVRLWYYSIRKREGKPTKPERKNKMFKVLYSTWNSVEVVGVCATYAEAEALRDKANEDGDWNYEEYCWIEEA